MDNKDKIIKTPTPIELSIGTFHHPQSVLKDQRGASHGIIFGTIEGIAKQYGVKMSMKGQAYVYTAPKNRLQLFVEKLHFARAQFFEI